MTRQLQLENTVGDRVFVSAFTIFFLLFFSLFFTVNTHCLEHEQRLWTRDTTEEWQAFHVCRSAGLRLLPVIPSQAACFPGVATVPLTPLVQVTENWTSGRIWYQIFQALESHEIFFILCQISEKSEWKLCWTSQLGEWSELLLVRSTSVDNLSNDSASSHTFAVLFDAESQVRPSFEPPVEGNFLLEWTWVLAPFPKTFGWEYRPTSSLCTHAFHHTDSKNLDIYVLDGWMPATKHPACTIHGNRMWLLIRLD